MSVGRAPSSKMQCVLRCALFTGESDTRGSQSERDGEKKGHTAVRLLSDRVFMGMKIPRNTGASMEHSPRKKLPLL